MNTFASWRVAQRAVAIQWVFGIAFFALSAAFVKAQVIDHQHFSAQSARNHLKHIVLEPPRGEIVDRNNLPIAQNVPGYSIKLLADNEDSLRAVLARFDQLIADDTVDVEGVVNRWRESKYQPALVYPSQKYDIVAELEEHRAVLPGLVIQSEPRRIYPDSNAVAHLVGYVGEVSPADLANNTFPGATSGELVGKAGIELQYDSLLRGRPGARFVEVTSTGRMIRDQPESGTIPPVVGKVLRTTIDLSLQRFVDSMWRTDLAGKRGALVAITPQGEVLAYYSAPTFNPNQLIGRIDAPTWTALNTDPNQPLYNRVIQATYPPASPFKIEMAALALRRGITMDTRMPVPCTGSFTFGNRAYRCWKPSGHGSETLREAIATSCDVYFYQLGLRLGADSILAGASAMGFGARSGIDLPFEHRGTMLTSVKAYVNSRGVSTWGNGETLNLAIGQGYHTETLMNMVSFYAAVASDGIKRAPHLLQGEVSRTTEDLHLSPDILADLRTAMLDVVNSGTATADLAHEVGLKEAHVAGKTGSAQMSGSQKQMAWFIAFAPAEAPRIVVGIAVEEGIHGAYVAKYPVRAIMHYLTGKSVKADFNSVTEDLLHSNGDSDTVLALPKPAKGRP